MYKKYSGVWIMAFTTVNDGSKYFQVGLWSGNDSTQTITNDGNSDLQPDWVWIKRRTGSAINHLLYDSTRGATKSLNVNETDAEGTRADGLTGFNSDGFDLGAGGGENSSGNTFVGWQWAANGGSRTTFNESGANPGGGYQANTTAGFSIVDYTGTGSAGTVSHGLGVTPKMIWIKDRDEAGAWIVYHENLGNTHFMRLNVTTASASESSNFNNTSPTSSVFTVGTSTNVNKDGNKYIAYCFAPVKGYSMFGTYKSVGNNNDQTGGEFIFTGFEPSLVIVKNLDADKNWIMISDGINPVNPADSVFYVDASNSEVTYGSGKGADLLSTGFKIYSGDSHLSNDGDDYIYMAWGKRPLVSSTGTPVAARRGGNG